MKFIIIPIEDAEVLFTSGEIEHARKSVDEQQMIVHEEILINKRNIIGIQTLPTEDTGQFEWTYPVYEHNSKELEDLLNSKQWYNEEEV